MRSMYVNLIPPFMMRLAGIEVDECPKFLSPKPSEVNHSLYCPMANVRIPLHLDGIISYIPTRLPLKEELNDLEVIELTPMTDVWDPHDSSYSEQEHAMVDYKGQVKSAVNKASTRHFIAASVITSSLDPVSLDHALSDLYPETNPTSQTISSVRNGRDECELYSEVASVTSESVSQEVEH